MEKTHFVDSKKNLIKTGIWLYFLLLVGEGVLRKWITPGLSTPLLIVRDPVLVGIYLLALSGGFLPLRGGLVALGALALGSFCMAAIAGTPPLVAMYGFRVNYFHVPLIFVMGAVMDRDDVLKIGRVVLWLTPPIAVLMLMQFRAPQGSWLNAGAGGELDSQLRGALGKVRPPGPFSFITGPVLWFSLATAFVVDGWLRAKAHPRWLVLAATGAIVVAIPISISRMLMFSVLVVMVFAGFTLASNPRRLLTLMLPLLLAGVVFLGLKRASLTDAFAVRWDESGSTDIQASIVDRFFGDFLQGFRAMAQAKPAGEGMGMGSNIAARYTTGDMGFLLAESEWPKVMLELGPFLGAAFILYRVWLGLAILVAGRRGLASGETLPWLLSGACFLPLVSGQWAPPTVLGFAVLGGGLVLAASNEPEGEEDGEDEEDGDVAGDEKGEEEEDAVEEPPPRRMLGRRV